MAANVRVSWRNTKRRNSICAIFLKWIFLYMYELWLKGIKSGLPRADCGKGDTDENAKCLWPRTSDD
jgi:hypothetical protein